MLALRQFRLVLWLSISTATSTSPSSPSSILKSVVAGGATQVKSINDEQSSVLGFMNNNTSNLVEQEEVILIKKRDGRREALNGAKVRMIYSLRQGNCQIFIHLNVLCGRFARQNV